MADLSAFAGATFDSTDWINGALREIPEEEDLSSFLSSLTMKLHIMSQDYTEQLETAMVESISAMPRSLSEISKLEQQLTEVEKQISSLSEQLNVFDERNVAGVEDLSRLDILKENMEKCKATLEEHARWSQLVREAKSLLEGGGRLSDTAERIETMFRSLDILQNLPGHEERTNTCESFKESLLSAVRPRLRRDVAGLDLAVLADYLFVFKKLRRDEEIEQEYVRARPQKLASLWDSYSYEANGGLAAWLAVYLGKAARLIADEQQYTVTLFGAERGGMVLQEILCQAVSPLRRSIGSRLQQFGAAPEVAFDCYCVGDEFAKRVLSLMLALSSTNTSSSSSSLPPAFSPLLSSTEGRDAQQQQAMAAVTLLDAVYGGFVDYIPHFIATENAFLKSQFQAVLSQVSFRAVQLALEEEREEMGGLGTGMGTGFGTGGLTATSEDTLAAFSKYSEKLLFAADAIYAPLEGCLRRATQYMGGMQIKRVLRGVIANVLAGFFKSATIKLEELSRACCLPPSPSFSSSISVSLSSHKGVMGMSGGQQQLQQQQGKVGYTSVGAGFDADASADPGMGTGTGMGSGSGSNSMGQQPEGGEETLAGGEEVGSAVGDSDQSVMIEQYARRLEESEVESRMLVMCSLHALQAAGRLCRNVRNLRNLAETLLWELNSSLLSHQPSLSAALSSALENNSNNNNSGGAVSIGKVYAAYLVQADVNLSAELQSFLSSSISSALGSAGTSAPFSGAHLAQSSAFAGVQAPMARMCTAAGSLLLNLCLEAPRKLFRGLAHDAIWHARAIPNESASSESSVGAREGEGVRELMEHMLPQGAITQVGEHLLSLVQELEGFASSEALPDILMLRGECSSLSALSPGWAALKSLLEMTEEESIEGLSRRSTCSSLVAGIEASFFGVGVPISSNNNNTSSFSSSATSTGEIGGEERQEDRLDADDSSSSSSAAAAAAAVHGGDGGEGGGDSSAFVLAFVNEWLSAISDAIVGLLVQQVALIPAISVAGAAQLATDLEYLSNVVNAVGIRPHPLLEHIGRLVTHDASFLLGAVEVLPAWNVRGGRSVSPLLRYDRVLLCALLRGCDQLPPELAAVPIPTMPTATAAAAAAANTESSSSAVVDSSESMPAVPAAATLTAAAEDANAFMMMEGR